MSAPAPRRSLNLILSLAAVVAYAVLIQWVWGWGAILKQWSSWSIAATICAMLLMFATYLLRAYRILDYFHRQPGITFRECCRITLLHNLANNLLPMRSGEASFPLMMRTSFGLPLSKTTGTLLLFRALDLHALIAIGCIPWIIHSESPVLLWPLWLIFLCAPLLLMPFQNLFADKLLARLPAKLSGLFSKLLSGMPSTLPDLLRSATVTWLNWAIKLAVFSWILMSFSEFRLVQAVTAAAGGELSSILPFHAPGGVGTYEAGVVAGAVLTGAQVDSSVAAAINLHLMIILSTLLGGLISPLIAPTRGKQ